MKKKITRRSALKKVAGTAGAAVAASLSESRGESGIEFSPSDKKKPYERPSVVWREKFELDPEPLSCAKQPGNPGCNPGPITN